MSETMSLPQRWNYIDGRNVHLDTSDVLKNEYFLARQAYYLRQSGLEWFQCD